MKIRMILRKRGWYSAVSQINFYSKIIEFTPVISRARILRKFDQKKRFFCKNKRKMLENKKSYLKNKKSA